MINLTGLTVEEAQAAYADKNINIQVAEEVFDAEVEAGKIISQEPPYEEGATIPENSTIELTVSKGIETVEMQKVVGMKYDEAERLLKEELKLEVEKIEETSETVEKDYVIRQEPEEGTELETGDTVKVYVSIGTGIKEVSVPYVIGDTEEDAKTKLADLEVTVVYEEDMTRTDGRVLRQSIEAGETVDEGTKITITVNRIEERKQGTINLNFKSLLLKSPLKDSVEITIDETTGQEIVPTMNLIILVDDSKETTTVYNIPTKIDNENVEATAWGKGTVTVKVEANGMNIWEGQFDLSGDNPTLVID